MPLPQSLRLAGAGRQWGGWSLGKLGKKISQPRFWSLLLQTQGKKQLLFLYFKAWYFLWLLQLLQHSKKGCRVRVNSVWFSEETAQPWHLKVPAGISKCPASQDMCQRNVRSTLAMCTRNPPVFFVFEIRAFESNQNKCARGHYPSQHFSLQLLLEHTFPTYKLYSLFSVEGSASVVDSNLFYTLSRIT